MAITTNVPAPTFGANGFDIPEAADILQGVLQDFNTAFGGGLNLSLETPQGQLASSITALVDNANETFLFMTQMFDPAYAFGRYQDALARIYFIERNPSESTVVQATCVGLPGLVIPAGSLAQAEDGNFYVSTQDGTIPVGGSVTIPFACETPGAIPCAANTLTTIYQSIPGWDSINNPADGVIGQDTETRANFEARRFSSVANNAMGFLPAVLGAVLKVPGVLDAYVTENFTGSPITVTNVSIAAHSIYVAVVGGTAADVGKAIWSKKSPGCDMTGNTTVTVTDDQSGYTPPFPSYTIKFQTPSVLPILFEVDLQTNALVPADAATQIQNALIAAFAGEDGGPRARIGSEIFASRFYGNVAALGSWVQIKRIQIGSQNTAAASGATSSIAGTVLTVGGTLTGTWAVGQTVVCDGIIPGTVITSLGSGSGGAGTYNINITQTIASRKIYGVLADQDFVNAQIDQSPNLSAANIVVTAT